MDTKEAILSTISELGNATKIDIDNNVRNDIKKVEQDISINIREETKNNNFDDEIITLLRLKEKSLVLFEGLKNARDTALERKLEMVISYLEYQLYIIEDRLKAIQEISNKQD
ncbi:MAG: hypothetical protein IKC84_03510 [Helicobacteraceae bacterium]|nr:hypothetical protein [Helicobacteraceae bacterium]